MTTAIQYRYGLDKSSRKFTCPQCRQKKFVRCIDFETNDYLPDHVGRCDRENGCGYIYNWNDWLKESEGQGKLLIKKFEVETKPVTYLPLEFVRRSIGEFSKNHLFLFLSEIFSEDVAHDVFNKYLIGNTKHWEGACVFWQLDEKERVRQGKAVLYNKHTGKRVKEGAEVNEWDYKNRCYRKTILESSASAFLGKRLYRVLEPFKETNFEQCFFGQHLLAEFPDRPVCIVESEKTALIASVYMPQFNWIATGGAISGCKWREYSVYKILNGRDIRLFPDYGYANKRTLKTCYEEWCERADRIREKVKCRIIVSDILERRLAGQDRDDSDLADLLIVRDRQTGIALADEYPATWNYQFSYGIKSLENALT